MKMNSDRVSIPANRANDFTVSVVLPVFNEFEILDELCAALGTQLDQIGVEYEILFVNDGSTDRSDWRLDRLAESNSRVKVVHFSRNFGHQAAVQAGLCSASGDVIIVMDSDMQDEPTCIPNFIKHWQLGFDVVYAVRTKRKELWLKRAMFHLFYRVLNALSSTRIPNDAGVFSLMDRKVVDSMAKMAENDRFMPGLRQWVGFRQIGLPVERNPRHDNQPRVSLYQLFQLAKTALFSFSRVPLSSFYAIASISVLVCAGCVGFSLYHKWVTGLAIPGWASMTIIGSFFGALNALGIGVLGEYVVRIYDQVRNRPQYIIARTTNFESNNRSTVPSSAETDTILEQKILDSVVELGQHVSERNPIGLPIPDTDSCASPTIDSGCNVSQ